MPNKYELSLLLCQVEERPIYTFHTFPSSLTREMSHLDI